jgi:hypothetical protein
MAPAASLPGHGGAACWAQQGWAAWPGSGGCRARHARRVARQRLARCYVPSSCAHGVVWRAVGAGQLASHTTFATTTKRYIATTVRGIPSHRHLERERQTGKEKGDTEWELLAFVAWWPPTHFDTAARHPPARILRGLGQLRQARQRRGAHHTANPPAGRLRDLLELPRHARAGGVHAGGWAGAPCPLGGPVCVSFCLRERRPHSGAAAGRQGSQPRLSHGGVGVRLTLLLRCRPLAPPQHIQGAYIDRDAVNARLNY